ncbi:hypothetical protein B0H17DRAFT_1206391 [Mycena rosella]|uniref:F-box domain-containing protein n=1 Tax=Mycena rosella TaxID=1033263 RepID=A0AAD7D5L4_MYCRO|nr:hypothetical protein B0H17DRAFT_1206391 [Mycena rosella]
MSTDPNLPPSLPADLERLIFELTATLYPEHMPDLLLIARRVKIWIEPLLYRVLFIYGPEHQGGLGDLHFRPRLHSLARYRNFIHTKPASFFHAHVRHVFFVGIRPADDITEILAVCGASVNIALSLVQMSAPVLPLLGALPLQRFSGYLSNIFTHLTGPDFTHPLFTQLTHLDIRDNYLDSWDHWADLALVPHLSHLSLRRKRGPHSGAMCGGVLAHCDGLKVLVIVFHSYSDLNESAPIFAEVAADRRFVMLVVADYKADWEEGARGGEDYWVRAEEAVKSR